MGEHRVVGRAAAGAAGLQHRGVEPAAVLVGALEVEAGRPDAVRAVAQREGVGGAGVEPDVEDVGDLLPLVVGRGRCRGSAPWRRPRTRRRRPRVSKASLMRALTAGSRRISARAVGVAPDEAGQRHAPGALARQHPVGAGLDHRVEPVAAGLRRPLHEPVDRGQRPLADGAAVGVHAVVERLVDGDEPLRGVAVDHRRLGAPGMRVAVGQPAAGEQRAGLDQLVDDGRVRRALLALGVEDLAGRRRSGTCAAKDESSRTLWVIRSTRPFLTKSS